VAPTPECSFEAKLAWRDARIAELEAALAAQPARPTVVVQQYEESCGTSYFVTLVRPDRAADAKAWDPGTWTLSQHTLREHADEEAEELRRFLDPQVPLSEL